MVAMFVGHGTLWRMEFYVDSLESRLYIILSSSFLVYCFRLVARAVNLCLAVSRASDVLYTSHLIVLDVAPKPLFGLWLNLCMPIALVYSCADLLSLNSIPHLRAGLYNFCHCRNYTILTNCSVPGYSLTGSSVN